MTETSASAARRAPEKLKAPAAAAAAAAAVVALVPRGEVIRNFVYSGAFDRVAEEIGLTLVGVVPNEEMRAMLAARYGALHELEDIEEARIVRIQRELLEMAHGRRLWSRAAQERWRLRDSEAKSIRDKTFRAVKKALAIPFANAPGIKVLARLERASSRALRSTGKYVELLEELRPKLVFNGSHIHSRNATQVVQAAQWLGIKTATFVFSWDNLTSQGRIMLPYDYFLVWNDELKSMLLDMYDWIRPENVFVTGTPQFDFHFRPGIYENRESFCRNVLGLANGERYVLYTTGMPNHMPGEELIVEQIADILAETAPGTRLVVRVYPKDRTHRFDALKARRKDIVFPEVAWETAWLTPRFEDSAALVNTLRHADLGINVASTVSLELCMFDKPVINVGYNPPGVPDEVLKYADYYEFDHYKPVVESGAVEVAYSADELKTLIRAALAEPTRDASKRKALIERMFGTTLDGRSGDRVAEVLVGLANID